MSDLPPNPPEGSGPPPPPPYGSMGGGPTASSVAWNGPPLADWPTRVVAALIDGAIGLAGFALIAIVALIIGQIVGALGAFLFVLDYLATIGYAIVLGYWVGLTGQTIGKRTMGVKIVRMDDGVTLGAGAGIARQLLHVLDNVCLIGYLFPLWDPLHQTFADKIVRTVPITVPKQPFSLSLPTAQ